MENSPNLDDFDKVFGPQSHERVEPPASGPGAGPAHSTLGKASFWLAIAALALWGIGMILDWGVIIITILLSALANLLGLIFGIIALSQKRYSKGFAIAGTIINGLFILLLVIGFLWILSQF